MIISTNPKDFDCIVLLIPKSVVEQQDLDFTLSGLEKLLVNEETIQKSKNKLTVGFDGYDDDPRELYEIDEVRDYIQAITEKFPYWFYFCSTKDHSLWIILMAHCKFRKFGPGAAKVETKDARKIMAYLFSNLNEFLEKHNLGQSELKSLTKEIREYFSSHIIPTV
jgi:hypothetical protein